jgi:hypothetical protein
MHCGWHRLELHRVCDRWQRRVAIDHTKRQGKRGASAPVICERIRGENIRIAMCCAESEGERVRISSSEDNSFQGLTLTNVISSPTLADAEAAAFSNFRAMLT